MTSIIEGVKAALKDLGFTITYVSYSSNHSDIDMTFERITSSLSLTAIGTGRALPEDFISVEGVDPVTQKNVRARLAHCSASSSGPVLVYAFDFAFQWLRHPDG